jgi:hypothetical protein
MTIEERSQLQEKAARNQSQFRELNERAGPWSAAHNWSEPPMPDWVCECAFETCTAAVPLTVGEYEAVRAEPTHFLVSPSPDHVLSAVEDVVLRNERYWVVEKVARGGEVSELLDPRSDGH